MNRMKLLRAVLSDLSWKWLASALVLIAVCCNPSLGRAQVLSENVPFLAEPDTQWIALIGDGDLRLLKADLMKSPEYLHLSAYASTLPEDFWYAGVVRFSDGKVVSSPFHPLGKLNVPRESSKLAQEKIAAIEAKLNVLATRQRELADESARLRKSLRHEAGLDDVDEIYDRVAKFESRLRELGVDLEKAE